MESGSLMGIETMTQDWDSLGIWDSLERIEE
jgi:hypothetical protein